MAPADGVTPNAEPSPVIAVDTLDDIDKEEHGGVPDKQRYLQSVTFHAPNHNMWDNEISRDHHKVRQMHEKDAEGGARRTFYATNFSTAPVPGSRLDIARYPINGSSKLESNSSSPSSDSVTSGAKSLGPTFRNYPMTSLGSIAAVLDLVAQCRTKREKIPIFSSWPLMLYLITLACQLLGVTVGTIRAGQTPAQRGDVIGAFDDPKHNTFSVLVVNEEIKEYVAAALCQGRPFIQGPPRAD